jgi:hypothetical protein
MFVHVGGQLDELIFAELVVVVGVEFAEELFRLGQLRRMGRMGRPIGTAGAATSIGAALAVWPATAFRPIAIAIT